MLIFSSAFYLLLYLPTYLGAIASDEYLRVCPSVTSHKGWAWTNRSFSHKHWYVDVSLRISGRHKTGADGMVRIIMIKNTGYLF